MRVSYYDADYRHKGIEYFHPPTPQLKESTPQITAAPQVSYALKELLIT